MEGVTSSGFGSSMPKGAKAAMPIVKPAIAAATKTAQADKVRAVKLKVKVGVKKKLA